VEVEIGTDTVSLREETALSFVGYNHMFSSDTDYREGRVVVVADTFVDLYELGRAAPIASIGLAGKHFMDLLVDADGRSESVVSWVQENQVEGEPSEAAVTALETGASPTIVYRGLGSRVAAVITLPDGDDWFALRDGRVDEPAVSVYRNSVLLGSVDADWAWKVDDEYRTRERPLEPGPSAYVRHCDESGCASHRFHLDPPSLEEVATVALPEPGLRAYYSRAIACGGADLWVVTQAVPGDATRHWAMRIPGRAGFP
jgi:hypothetical protein